MQNRVRALALLAAVLSFGSLADEATAPTGLVVSFQTVSYQGRYAPRHVLGAWLVDSEGKHLRDLVIYGGKQANKLARWRQDTGKAKPDATTGATRKLHEPLTVTWDGTDAAGKPLPDGAYTIRLEFTETNRPGPVLDIPVRKGGEPVAREVAGNEHFTAITVRPAGPGKEPAQP
jgi:hypothetical protein